MTRCEEQWKTLSCIFEGILMPEWRMPINTSEELSSLLHQGDTQCCSQISPAKASPKKSTAMLSLINWTIWVCERKQRNIWGENMNQVTVCFSLNHPDWLIISLNPKAADTASPLGITLLVSSANCLPVSIAYCCFVCVISSPLSLILSYVFHPYCLENGGDSGNKQHIQVSEFTGYG